MTEVGQIGHNFNLTDEQRTKLRGFLAEIEHISEEISELSKERTEMYRAAKDAGFDTKALREVIKLRKMDAGKREALQAAVEAYLHALGDFASTPLGQASMPNGPQPVQGG